MARVNRIVSLLGVLACLATPLAPAAPAMAGTISVPGDVGTIQQAIDLALDGDEIVVGPGIYAERIDLGDKSIYLRSSEGASLTTIDGTGLGGSVVRVAGGQDAACVVEGFTVRGGSGSGGGGFDIDGSSPVIRGCLIVANAGAEGGGVRVRDGGPALVDCTLSANNGADGGAVHARESATPLLTGCQIVQNGATDGGGVFAIGQSDVTLVNCVLRGNVAQSTGGAMYCFGSSNATLANCTVAFNTANTQVGGLFNFSDSNALIGNSILWGNGGNQIVDAALSASRVLFSTIESGWSGSGYANDDADPLFISTNDLHLQSGSPCVDAGNDVLVPSDTADVDQNGDVVERTPLDVDRLPRFRATGVRAGDGGSEGCGVVDKG
ncbi:MAG: right-handed parallel beta-helix repeat-containing protein, partial [Planctomycetota bacterium]